MRSKAARLTCADGGAPALVILGRAKRGVSDRTAQTTLGAQFATSEQLLANIRILDAVTRSAAADGKPIAL